MQLDHAQITVFIGCFFKFFNALLGLLKRSVVLHVVAHWLAPLLLISLLRGGCNTFHAILRSRPVPVLRIRSNQCFMCRKRRSRLFQVTSIAASQGSTWA